MANLPRKFDYLVWKSMARMRKHRGHVPCTVRIPGTEYYIGPSGMLYTKNRHGALLGVWR
jgi:hypothetical protein